MKWLAVAIGLLAVTCSGCIEGGSFSNGADSDGAGQSASADGRVFFNGVKNAGFTDSDAFDCDGDAAVDGFVNGAGSVLLEVKDALGMTLASINFDGSGQEQLDDDVSGNPGSWSIDVTVRAGGMHYPNGWSGQYALNVYC